MKIRGSVVSLSFGFPHHPPDDKKIVLEERKIKKTKNTHIILSVSSFIVHVSKHTYTFQLLL